MSRELIDVDVRAIASGGAGVADLPDGRVVFVPRTLPGDRARIRIEKSHNRWATGALDRLIESGDGRIAADCALYDECGGCQLQHMPYEDQLDWKARFVTDALTRIGGITEAPTPEVVPSPRQTGYRNRVTMTLRRLRGGHTVAGFHALGRPAHVIDVADECLLPDPSIGEAWGRLRSAWGSGARHLPRGGRLQLTIRRTGEQLELLVDGGEAGWTPADLDPVALGFAAVFHRPQGAGEADRVFAGEDAEESLTAGAFTQVNDGAAELLRAHVLESVADLEPGHAVDAYSGIGTIGAELAAAGWLVTAIEFDQAAVALAEAAAPAVRVRQGRVEELLGSCLPTDLLVMNPPRTGVNPDACLAITLQPPPTIVYVSCDPATLARDVSLLKECYRVDSVRSFDLFPQTAHVETVAVLKAVA